MIATTTTTGSTGSSGTGKNQRRRRQQLLTLIYHSLLPYIGIWIIQQQQQFHGVVVWETDDDGLMTTTTNGNRIVRSHPFHHMSTLVVVAVVTASSSWFNYNHATGTHSQIISPRRRPSIITMSTTTTSRRHYYNTPWNYIVPPQSSTLAFIIYNQSRGGSTSSTTGNRNGGIVDVTTMSSNDNNEMMPSSPGPEITTVSKASSLQQPQAKKKVMIIMDGFCSYHSGYFQQRIQEIFPNVILFNVVSDYLYRYYYLQQQQQQNDQISANDDDDDDDDDTTNDDSPSQEPQTTQLPIQRPQTLKEVHALLNSTIGIPDHNNDTSNNSTTNSNNHLLLLDEYDFVGVYCESDSGLECAEQLRQLVNISCHDIPIVSPARRLKHLMQQMVHQYAYNNNSNSNNGDNNDNTTHLPIAKQQLCHSLEQVQEFAQKLFNECGDMTNDHNNNDTGSTNTTLNDNHNHQHQRHAAVVIKPIRGVASESVALCHTMDDVIRAWNTITSSQIFGATTPNVTTESTTSSIQPSPQYHTNVLVQEYLYGTEYAVDVVSRNGEHKVTAVWRYEKHSSPNRYNTTTTATGNTNGTNAPFCYYRTELIDETMLEREELFETICHYVTQSLTALGVRYGVSHNEVIVPFDRPHQPYLIEVNCRQHNMDFIPIVMNCLGYNCLDVTLVAYLGDDTTWDVIPHRPPLLRRYGSMVHLVNSAPVGYLLNNHPMLDQMMQLDSVYDAEVYEKYCTEGSYLSSPTVDIRSDAGWVQLIHDDAETMERDYRQIVDWMPMMFQTSPSPLEDASNTATVDGK